MSMTYDEGLAFFADLSDEERAEYNCANGTESLALRYVNEMLKTMDTKMISIWTERTIGKAGTKAKSDSNTNNEDAMRLREFLRGDWR